MQAWRAGTWEPGACSVVRFTLQPQDAGTLLALDQAGFPDGQDEHLKAGWHANYWKPMKKYLGEGGPA